MLNPHRNFHTYFQHDLIYYVLVKIDKCLVVNYAFGSKLSITKHKRETIFQSIWCMEFLKVFQNPIRIPKIPNREI